MGEVPVNQLLEGWIHLDGRNLASRLSLGLRQLIATGMMTPGDQLPAERVLARLLHVSRPTVSAALDTLRDEGLVVSRQGSGTRVAFIHADRRSKTKPFIDSVLTEITLNLAAAVPFDAAHIRGLELSAAELLAAEPDHGVAPHGLPALREAAACRLGEIGLASSPDRIVITAGAHGGLRASFDLLSATNSPVIVEEFTYGAVVDLAFRTGANLFGLPRDRDGVDPERLDALIRRIRPAFVLLAPSIHSPSGWSTDRERLLGLAEVLNRARVPVVIDETYAELHYEGRPEPLARHLVGPNITVESVSKTAWAGLRTGWIRVSDDLWTTFAAAFEADLGQPVPSQMLTYKILNDDYNGLLATRRRDLRERGQYLRQHLVELLPGWTALTPDGGLTHWIDTGAADSTATSERASHEGVLIAPGATFHHRRATSSFVRICHDRPDQLIAAAVERIATGQCRPDRSR